MYDKKLIVPPFLCLNNSIKAIDALEHPWFQDLRAADPETQAPQQGSVPDTGRSQPTERRSRKQHPSSHHAPQAPSSTKPKLAAAKKATQDHVSPRLRSSRLSPAATSVSNSSRTPLGASTASALSASMSLPTSNTPDTHAHSGSTGANESKREPSARRVRKAKPHRRSSKESTAQATQSKSMTIRNGSKAAKNVENAAHSNTLPAIQPQPPIQQTISHDVAHKPATEEAVAPPMHHKGSRRDPVVDSNELFSIKPTPGTRHQRAAGRHGKTVANGREPSTTTRQPRRPSVTKPQNYDGPIQVQKPAITGAEPFQNRARKRYAMHQHVVSEAGHDGQSRASCAPLHRSPSPQDMLSTLYVSNSPTMAPSKYAEVVAGDTTDSQSAMNITSMQSNAKSKATSQQQEGTGYHRGRRTYRIADAYGVGMSSGNSSVSKAREYAQKYTIKASKRQKNRSLRRYVAGAEPTVGDMNGRHHRMNRLEPMRPAGQRQHGTGPTIKRRYQLQTQQALHLKPARRSQELSPRVVDLRMNIPKNSPNTLGAGYRHRLPHIPPSTRKDQYAKYGCFSACTHVRKLDTILTDAHSRHGRTHLASPSCLESAFV